MIREIWLAGGCYWGVEQYCAGIRGVTATEVGFAGGKQENPTYAQVKKGDTGHAETVRVTYDDAVLPLRALLRLFFRIIDPTLRDRQGHDVGHQYRTAVFYGTEADGETVREELGRLQKEWDAPVVTECLPLERFWPAEEYHQKYLEKNPDGYCHVPLALIRWVRGIDPVEETMRDGE